MLTLRHLTTLVTPPSREAAREVAIEATRAKRGIGLAAVRGYVDHIADDGFTVMTPEIRVGVRIDELTVFRTEDSLASPGDIHPGSSVQITGRQQLDGRFLADVVLVRPAP